MILKKPKFWNEINLISLILLPFSAITLLINIIKSILITQYTFRIPIICVGNIFIGGTGKTPLSIYIYNLLKNKKFKPAIVRKYYPSHADEINFTKSKVRQFFSDRKRLVSISNAITALAPRDKASKPKIPPKFVLNFSSTRIFSSLG